MHHILTLEPDPFLGGGSRDSARPGRGLARFETVCEEVLREAPHALRGEDDVIEPHLADETIWVIGVGVVLQIEPVECQSRIVTPFQESLLRASGQRIMYRPRRAAPCRPSTRTAAWTEKPLWRQVRRLRTVSSPMCEQVPGDYSDSNDALLFSFHDRVLEFGPTRRIPQLGGLQAPYTQASRPGIEKRSPIRQGRGQKSTLLLGNLEAVNRRERRRIDRL